MSFSSHRRTRAVLAPAAIAACALACSAAPAMADTQYSCTTPGATQGVTVPAGAVSATINLAGGAGGSVANAAGGDGADLNVSLPVTPGQNLTLEVACPGAGGVAGGSSAGAGGGATVLRFGGTVWAVAGGGGGAAPAGGYPVGAAGGNAGADGVSGTGYTPADAGQGGLSGDNGGFGGAAGQGITPAGAGGNGGLLQGGDGGYGYYGFVGGGGGAGYAGGGGGGGGTADDMMGQSGGGSGGGGSSYYDSSAGVVENNLSPSQTSQYGAASVSYVYAGAGVVSPNPVEFGKVVATGTNSAQQTVTYTNVSSGANAPITLGQVSVDNPQSFSLGTDNCSGVTLTPGQTCTVTTVFSPASDSQGDLSASLSFPSDAVNGAVIAQLRGDALAPADMSVLPGSLNFGSVATNASATQTVAIYNTGDVPLDVNSAAISGPDAGEFSVVTQQNLCPAHLSAGSSCTLQVQFAPSSVAPAQGTLTLTSDNAETNPSVAVALSGTGTTPTSNGTNGTNGIDGVNGAQGLTGATGSAGASGATGPKGDAGATGPAGPKGETGPRGAGGLGPVAALSRVTLLPMTTRPCAGCRTTGLLLTFRLKHTGQVHATLERRSGSRWSAVDAETISASSGLHYIPLDKVFSAGKLRRGGYRLVVQSQNGKAHSAPFTLTFRIKP